MYNGDLFNDVTTHASVFKQQLHVDFSFSTIHRSSLDNPCTNQFFSNGLDATNITYVLHKYFLYSMDMT